VGSYGDSYMVDSGKHFLSFGNDFPWQDGRYGIAPVKIAATSNFFDYTNRNGSMFGTSEQVFVPQDGTTQGNVTLATGAWIYADGSTGQYQSSTTPYFHTHLHIDDVHWADDPNGLAGYSLYSGATMDVWRDGTVRMIVSEDQAKVGRRDWIWGRSTSLATGWHYISAEFQFTPSAVTNVLRIDDTVMSKDVTIVPGSGGFRYTNVPVLNHHNWVNVVANIPSQHVQWWRTFQMGSNYVAGQQNPPVNSDGLVKAVVTQSHSEMNWIPNVYMASGWDTLKHVVSAEFGALTVDEYGVIHYIPHYKMRSDATAVITGGSLPSINLTDDDLLALTVNPTDDHYRNTVSIEYVDRFAQRAIVYNAQDPWEYVTYTSATPNTFTDIDIGDDVVSVQTSPIPHMLDGNAPQGGASTIDGAVSGLAWSGIPLYATSIHVSTSSYSAGVTDVTDQRFIEIQVYAPTEPIFLAYLPGNQAALSVAGLKYTDKRTNRILVQNPDQVTARGMRLLELPEDEWRQGFDTALAIGTDLLVDTVNPAPLLENVAIRADPRLQLLDVIGIKSEDATTGTMYAQVIGIECTDQAGSDGTLSSKDTLTLREITTPHTWRLGDPDLSQLGLTTVLG
jgi:hypothetical protein